MGDEITEDEMSLIEQDELQEARIRSLQVTNDSTIDRIKQEKRDTEQRLLGALRETEASLFLLRDQNVAMQMRINKAEAELKRVNAEKEEMKDEYRKKEVEMMKQNEEKSAREQREAQNTEDKLRTQRDSERDIRMEKERILILLEEELKRTKLEIQKVRQEKEVLERQRKTERKVAKEERNKASNDLQKMMEESAKELSKNYQEKESKIEELNKTLQENLKLAHEEYKQLQENYKTEVTMLLKEKELIIRESAAKHEEMAGKTLELSERKNVQLFALANQSAHSEIMMMKEHSEFAHIAKCGEDSSKIQSIKSALIDDVSDSLELWAQLELSNVDSNLVKDNINGKSQVIKKNIDVLRKSIDESSSLGDNKTLWKNELKRLNTLATNYARSVRREIQNEETTMTRFNELEDECEKLKNALHDLPDLEADTFAALINRSAQRTIRSAENRGLIKEITVGKNDENIGKKDIKCEPVIEEPQ
ncbi:hypothetical protein PENTCL1PPCAC_5407 [Pristionchus entomophagus]|uniref:Uncharacterized protein n=1 Tax=Pristionchus entomophagus TaxID=358040 RepID=A0AAV5SIQ7_9BILA|nr:hypothetical protein PENTCL1PPCAC_5407 [Pristionchus entomophagus]